MTELAILAFGIAFGYALCAMSHRVTLTHTLRAIDTLASALHPLHPPVSGGPADREPVSTVETGADVNGIYSRLKSIAQQGGVDLDEDALWAEAHRIANIERMQAAGAET